MDLFPWDEGNPQVISCNKFPYYLDSEVVLLQGMLTMKRRKSDTQGAGEGMETSVTVGHDPLFSVRSCLQARCPRRCASALGPARGARKVSVGHHSGDLWAGNG